jgi:predicted PurR-regulated permease PerM
MTSSYNATLSDYNASITAVSNASSQINNAIKRYGTGDTRVSGLQKELQELRLSLKANEDKLKNALFSQIAFKALAQNASNVAFRAATLPPKESEFDFVLLGGVIVLVAAFAYAIFYLRKKRPPRETGLPVGRAEFAEKINVSGPGAGGV